VFQRLQQQTSQRLVESAVVLTSDFAFRGAIASNDRETILSVLRNHAGRRQRDRRIAGEPAGHCRRRHPDASRGGAPVPEPAARRPRPTAWAAPRASACWAASRTIGDRPVLAPRPIAWVSMDFVIDDGTARD
jgi:hypothetical protein